MLNDTRTRVTLALLAVLAVVAVFIVMRDARASDAEEKRTTDRLTCAVQVDEGLPQSDDC